MKDLKSWTYFPGCSLKDTGKDFERSGLAVMQALGQPLQEMERWYCCGTMVSQTEDNLMQQIGPVRDLIQVQDSGAEEVVALCSMCFNTLKRANAFVTEDESRLTKINNFMDREADYAGHVQVLHLLEVLRDHIGWDALEHAVQHPLEGLRVACYYGCALLRPRGVGIDVPDAPQVMQDFVESLWAEPVPFPFEGECCGAYQSVDHRDLVAERSQRILNSARLAGADVVITACPLCQYNLEDLQKDLQTAFSTYEEMPVIYFTQLAALALGVESGEIPTALRAKLPLPDAG